MNLFIRSISKIAVKNKKYGPYGNKKQLKPQLVDFMLLLGVKVIAILTIRKDSGTINQPLA